MFGRELEKELIGVIGEVAAVALAEEFAGTRLHVPSVIGADHAISQAVGPVAARALSERFSPSVIRVPLLRELRASHYRARGLSHAKIATRLGITENGVGKLLKRIGDVSEGVTEAV